METLETPPATLPRVRTASDLKYHVENAGHDSLFFTRETMRYFGDTMRNYSVRQPRPVTVLSGATVQAFELVRKCPVKHGLKASAWFDSVTFARVSPHESNALPR